MRRLLDRALWHLGYVRRDHTIHGGIEFKLHEPTFVDLTIPGPAGRQRVRGWVDTRLPRITFGDNPVFPTTPPPDCTSCGHPRDEHGDGVVHTKCCAMEKQATRTGLPVQVIWR